MNLNTTIKKVKPKLKQSKQSLQAIMTNLSKKKPEANKINKDYLELNTQFYIGQYLNYKDYDTKTGIFQNDKSYGFCMYATPINGASEQLANRIMGLFALRWPKGATMSFMLYSSKELKSRFDTWYNKRQDAANPVCREIAKNRIKHYMNGINKSLFENEKIMLRDYRMIISVTFDGELDNYQKNEINIFKKSFISTLNNLNIDTTQMNPDMLLDFTDEIFNRKNGFRDINYKYNKYTEIKHQVTGPATRTLIDKDGCAFNNTIVRGYTVKSYPEQAALAQAMDLIGDILNDSTQVSSQFLYCTNIWFPDNSSLKTKINAKSTRAIQNAESPMAKWVPDFADKAKDWKEVNKTLSDGQGLCYFNQAFFSFSELGYSNYAEQDLIDVFRSKGWNVVPTSFIEYPVFLSCLPMQFDNEMFTINQKLGLIRLLPNWNIVNILPIIGEWSGNSMGKGMMLLGRRGQLLNFDIFNSNGNYNVAIAADSGSGKSYFMNDLIISYLGLGAKIFMIDVGRSYLKLCEVLGGQFISFGKDVENVCLNPFSNIYGDSEDVQDDLRMIRDLVCEAISPTPLTNLETMYVGIAVNEVWYTKGRDACFHDVYERLMAHDEVLVRNLGIQLQPYSNTGIYSRYFNGKSNVDFNNQFVVLELDELNFKPDLRGVILSLLMVRIGQEMYLGDRNQLKICGIDEAWQLFKGGSRSQEFIEAGYRKARKYYGSFITIVQQINDYYANEGTRACLTNSEWQIMLKQKEESIDQLKEDKKLSLSDWQLELIKTVRTNKGVYSDVFIKGNGVGTPVRLIVDPYSNLVYTTDPQEFQLVENFKAQGYPTHEAINKALEYNGLEAA